MKQRRLCTFELKEAVRTEVRREKLRLASRRYTSDLAAQVGEPTRTERFRAEDLAKRIAEHISRSAG